MGSEKEQTQQQQPPPQQQAQQQPKKEGKLKRFSKRMGDSVIFGAGASIGNRIVNSIF